MNTATGLQLTAEPIRITGDVTFLPGSDVFPSGLDVQSGTVNFGTGVYTIAGAKPNANGTPGLAFQVTANSKILDGGVGNGEVFVLTRPDYGPDSGNPVVLDTTQSYLIQPLAANGTAFGNASVRPFGPLSVLNFGTSNLQAGQTDKADVSLRGLNGRPYCAPGSCGSPDAELFLYEPVLIWQDRRNKFYADSKLPNAAAVMHAQAGTIQGLKGTLYQPRRSLLELQGSEAHTGNAQIITGALDVQGNPNLALTAIVDPILVTRVSLVR